MSWVPATGDQLRPGAFSGVFDVPEKLSTERKPPPQDEAGLSTSSLSWGGHGVSREGPYSAPPVSRTATESHVLGKVESSPLPRHTLQT